MKCKGCSYLKIGYEDDKDYKEIARARCMATPRGRCLTWAVTTYYQTMLGMQVAEFDKNRVEEFMEDKTAPKWCPLRSVIRNEK